MNADSDTITQNEKFLMISAVLSESLVEKMYREYVPEAVKNQKRRGISMAPFEAAAIRDTSLKNAITCFTLYAYADIDLGTEFNVLFDVKHRGNFEFVPLILRQVVLLETAFYPVNGISVGSKHFCTFECPEGVPSLLTKYRRLADWNELSLEYDFGLTDRDSWNTLQKRYGGIQ